MSKVEAMKAVGMTIDKYLESTKEIRNGDPLDGEDYPIVGIFNNGVVIINIIEDEMKIDVKGGEPMQFDLDIDIFGKEDEANE